MSKVFAPVKARAFAGRMFDLYEEFADFQQGQTAAWRNATPSWQESPRGEKCSDFVGALEDAAEAFQEAIRTLEDGINQFEDG